MLMGIILKLLSIFINATIFLLLLSATLYGLEMTEKKKIYFALPAIIELDLNTTY